MKRFVLFTLLILFAGLAPAENVTRANGYAVHHNALTTDSLSAEVARNYGIRRSTSRGMVNIAVIRESAGTTGTPVQAKVKVVARNLMGQKRDIPVREIREGEAIYYIADFPVAHREHLIFEIEVLPKGEVHPLNARFEQEFFTR